MSLLRMRIPIFRERYVLESAFVKACIPVAVVGSVVVTSSVVVAAVIPSKDVPYNKKKCIDVTVNIKHSSKYCTYPLILIPQ